MLPPLLVLLAATVPACGGDDGSSRHRLLSSAAASRLRATLSLVDQRVADGDCTGAEAEARTLQEQVASLPQRLDADLRDALGDGAGRLQGLVVDHCEPVTGATGATGPTVPPAPEPTNEQKNKQKKQPEEPGKGKQKDKGNKDDGTQDGSSGGTETVPEDQTGGQQEPGGVIP